MRTTPLVRRAARATVVAVAAGFVAVGTATATSASEQTEAWPEHGHLLLIGVEETEDSITYRHCVEVADGRALPLHSHHDHFHRGTAGDALRRAGNFPVPMAPITPFGSCADVAQMMEGRGVRAGARALAARGPRSSALQHVPTPFEGRARPANGEDSRVPDTPRGARARSGPGPRAIDGGVRAPGPTAPHHLSRQDWREVLGRVGRLVLVERIPLLSAGIAFFAVLSIAPVLVTALSVYGAINTPQQALDQLSAMAGMLPPALEAVAADQLTTITTASTQVLTRQGLTALLFALWTATAATSSLIDALTVAYHETETRSIGRRTGLALLFVLGGALVLGAVIAAAGVVSRSLVGSPGLVRTGAQALVWVGVGTLMVCVLAVLYRLAPDRRQARWRWISWGAGGATVLWLFASAALFAYVQRLGTYESTYGSLAGVAMSMFWLWISVLLVVLGAAVNGEVERQTSRDSTVGPERPLGERGAVVADSAPPYPST